MSRFKLPYPVRHALIQLQQRWADLTTQPLGYRWTGRKLYPVTDIDLPEFESLLGIDTQKEKFRQNTEQFLHGQPANNILLTGARGTGKSTLIRAALKAYAPQGLRVVEVPFTGLASLPLLYRQLRQQSEKFIIFCDDLSFDRENSEFRALKSLLDGSLERPAHNILIYATSNRRHLLPDYYQDNQAPVEEIHPQEAIEEKIALSDRFGLWIPFYGMDQETYLAIAQGYIKQHGLEWTDDIRHQALQWAQQRGNRSGRLARQFSDYVAGRASMK